MISTLGMKANSFIQWKKFIIRYVYNDKFFDTHTAHIAIVHNIRDWINDMLKKNIKILKL